MTSEDGASQEQDEKEISYEDAMKRAFQEIFQNLKEIEKNTKMQRQRVNLERRRCNTPPTMLTETTGSFKQPKEKLAPKLSAPVSIKPSLSREGSKQALPASTRPSQCAQNLSTMHWHLACFEEDEDY